MKLSGIMIFSPLVKSLSSATFRLLSYLSGGSRNVSSQDGTGLFATFEATVNRGLEKTAESEIRDKLGIQAQRADGRVIFTTDVPINSLLKLRSINNLFLTIFDRTLLDMEMPTDESSLEEFLLNVSNLCDWRTGLEKWKQMSNFDNDIGIALRNDENLRDQQPKFRVSCKRNGCDHKFKSPDVCRLFGAAIIKKFGWPVKLKNSELDVYCNVSGNRFFVNLTLSPTCLSYRNIKLTGLTTLKASTCYSMLRKAQIQVGDIVLDPMSGSGAIPLESCSTWLDREYYGFSLGGEKKAKPLDIFKVNLTALEEKNRPPVDILRLDATKMPFCDNSIDVIASDLPFGQRHGSKRYNSLLYPAVLRDMARVARLNTGRAVLLTHDHKNMIEAYRQNSEFWEEKSSDYIKVGNLDCFIYLFSRNDRTFQFE